MGTSEHQKGENQATAPASCVCEFGLPEFALRLDAWSQGEFKVSSDLSEFALRLMHGPTLVTSILD